jgi:hypothetical protein
MKIDQAVTEENESDQSNEESIMVLERYRKANNKNQAAKKTAVQSGTLKPPNCYMQSNTKAKIEI